MKLLIIVFTILFSSCVTTHSTKPKNRYRTTDCPAFKGKKNVEKSTNKIGWYR